MSAITIRNLVKSFKDNPILRNINLDIEDGQCTVLVGPSGCGKSTLLRLICGLETIDEGEIFIGDELVNEIPPAYRRIAMVFQSYALYPHMSVFENMAFALRVNKLSKQEVKDRVLQAAKMLKIDALLERTPRQLSGGQRQRVAIGRAIVRKPQAFLFDEPLSNLDASLRAEMRYEIAGLKSQFQSTMVYVTHDQAEAMTLADKLVVLHNGHIEQIGSPIEVYNKPKNIFVAGFIGAPKINLIDGSLLKDADSSTYFVTSDNQKVEFQTAEPHIQDLGGQKVTLGVRPENITLTKTSTKHCLMATVSWVENLGNEVYVYSKLSNGQLINTCTHSSVNIKVGDEVFLKPDMPKAHIFDKNGNNVLG